MQQWWRDEGSQPTDFTGYETLEQHTTLGVLVEPMDGDPDPAWAVKLAESPFYATGGGQVADAGVVESESGTARARVKDVRRIGDDQMVLVEMETGELQEGERVVARVDRPRAPRRRPTTPPRTCCTPRCASAWGPMCARRAPTSGPTSCASTSPTASGSRRRTWRGSRTA